MKLKHPIVTTEDLTAYEAPWFADFISSDFLQDIIALFLANKVLRKLERHRGRIEGAELFSKYK